MPSWTDAQLLSMRSFEGQVLDLKRAFSGDRVPFLKAQNSDMHVEHSKCGGSSANSTTACIYVTSIKPKIAG